MLGNKPRWAMVGWGREGHRVFVGPRGTRSGIFIARASRVTKLLFGPCVSPATVGGSLRMRVTALFAVGAWIWIGCSSTAAKLLVVSSQTKSERSTAC